MEGFAGMGGGWRVVWGSLKNRILGVIRGISSDPLWQNNEINGE